MAGNRSRAIIHNLCLVTLLLVQISTALTDFPQVSAECVDLVADCGAKADNYTDDTVAFAECQTLASKHSGCITVPAGTYRVAAVKFSTSNIEVRIDNGAVFLLWNGTRWSEDGAWIPEVIFEVGIQHPTSADYIQNVSIHGHAPGKFTIDLSIAERNPWLATGVGYVGGIKGFLLANVHCKMSDPERNPLTQYPAASPCIGGSYTMFNGERLNPQDGILQNLSSVTCPFGYGLIQFGSAERIYGENLYSEGGVTYRLETGGAHDTPGGFLGDIYGKNITCKDGHAAVMSEPHVQQNGVFHVENILSQGCNHAVSVGGGYSDDGYPPGHFSNSSTMTNIVAIYGSRAQNSSKDVDVPSCSACLRGADMNYLVAVTAIKSVGFPPPSNRSECISYKRYPNGCPYNH